LKVRRENRLVLFASRQNPAWTDSGGLLAGLLMAKLSGFAILRELLFEDCYG